jgi:hypothetical protein
MDPVDIGTSYGRTQEQLALVPSVVGVSAPSSISTGKSNVLAQARLGWLERMYWAWLYASIKDAEPEVPPMCRVVYDLRPNAARLAERASTDVRGGNRQDRMTGTPVDAGGPRLVSRCSVERHALLRRRWEPRRAGSAAAQTTPSM